MTIMNKKQDKIEKEIAVIVSGALKAHRSVIIQDFGTFSVYHQRQEHRQKKDGSILLDPPADIVTFTPEK